MKDRTLYEDKNKEIFEQAVDFERVAFSVMGKVLIMATKDQKDEFVSNF